jgi:hypothetical protein
MLIQIKRKLNLNNFFQPKINTGIEPIAARGIELLAKDRAKLCENQSFETNRIFVRICKNSNIRDLVTIRGRNSIAVFQLSAQGKSKIHQLNMQELMTIKIHFVNKALFNAVCKAVNVGYEPSEEADLYLYPVKDKLIEASKITSKIFRQSRNNADPECLFKVGLILAPNESRSYMMKVNSLTSVRHKNTILKILHGDVYTNDRLFRHNLINCPKCLRCDQVDTLEHRLTTCGGTRLLMDKVIRLTNKLRIAYNPNETILESILAANNSNSVGCLAVHAEILSIIMSNKLIVGNIDCLINRVLLALIEKESNVKYKREIKDLLELAD